MAGSGLTRAEVDALPAREAVLLADLVIMMHPSLEKRRAPEGPQTAEELRAFLEARQ